MFPFFRFNHVLLPYIEMDHEIRSVVESYKHTILYRSRMQDSVHCCYMIHTTDGRHTYIGATNDPFRRLRQHNQEIAGGAKATSIQCNKGLSWVLGCYITNLPEWRTALQIEWRWKQLGRTQFRHIKDPIERRLHALKKLLSLEKPTSNSIPYESYPSGLPVIIWESEDCKRIYDSIDITYSNAVLTKSDPL